MHLRLGAFVWAWLASCASAFIVPEELVSFLSIVYSNIPPIKKGTDSRVGLGFRLGPHADAQIVLELGPQTNTRPLGANANAIPDSRKRHTPLDPLDPLVLKGTAPSDPTGAAGSNWLSAWRTSVALRQPSGPVSAQSFSGDDNHSDPTAPDADPTKLSGEPLVYHLRKLYRKIPTEPSLTFDTNNSSSTVRQPEPNNAPVDILKPFKRKPGSKPTVNRSTTLRPSLAPDSLSDVTLDD